MRRLAKRVLLTSARSVRAASCRTTGICELAACGQNTQEKAGQEPGFTHVFGMYISYYRNASPVTLRTAITSLRLRFSLPWHRKTSGRLPNGNQGDNGASGDDGGQGNRMMAKGPVGTIEQIKIVGRQVLEQSTQGIRYKDLVSGVLAKIVGVNPNNIKNGLFNLSQEPDVLRPSRGYWILKRFVNEETKPALIENEPQQLPKADEQAYYKPFAEWLTNEEQEVVEAIVVGGNTFKNKWATPDVIGTYKQQANDPVEFPLELVSVEIKIDANQSVTAFGQACAYRLFSHKVYIVMPITIQDVKDDLERLQALCTLFGMGLVLFKLDPDNPQFDRRVVARKFEPDTFYMNEFARRLQQTDPQAFNKLF